MKKKNIVLSFLAAILVTSSLLLFACGGTGNITEAYNAFNKLVVECNSNTNLFSQGEVEGLSTKYYLKDFHQKDSANQNVPDDKNYIILVAQGMNFIEKYHTELKDLENKYDVVNLTNSANNLTNSYNNLKVENANIANIESSEYEIYNGYFARYKLSAKNFINDVYSTALELGKFLNEKVRISVDLGTDRQTQKQIIFYLDYQLLLSYNDYRAMLIDSCQGQILHHKLYNESTKALTNMTSQIQSKQVKTDLTVETIKDLMNTCRIYNNQRAVYNKAVTNFSLKEFLTTYNEDLKAYEKANECAESYYNQLLDFYYNPNNFVTLFQTYLKGFFVA